MNISEAYTLQVLIETLDKSYELNDVTSINPELVKSLNDQGYSRVEVHNAVDAPNHSFMVGYKDNLFEIHHHHSDDSGGQILRKNVISQVPAKFVTTALGIIKKKVDSGYGVNIIASTDHIDSYHRLSKIIASKFGYDVTDHKPYDSDTRHFIIQPKSTFPVKNATINKQ